MKPAHSGFTLVEVLIAVTLVALILAPALAAFRVQLMAVDRLRNNEIVDFQLNTELSLATAALHIHPHPPALKTHRYGAVDLVVKTEQLFTSASNSLWHIEVSATHTPLQLTRHTSRYLWKPTAPTSQP